ncbi:MAG TPA: 23S rRNA (uracil(1939)-C(5))-methyltransferase RlmD [Acidobacteriaceae bacterium]|nr:23S rRNA (uracil(1939)-C(5))-methyltransferase RlmD [Acidobacteriaceae bacterium]
MKLHIEKPIYGGAGLARHEGKAVFVPFTLPGEEIDARIVADKGSYVAAELRQVIEPSSARVEAPCPYFGACGGCHYQHAAHAVQVEMKVAILCETLERARLRDLPDITTLTGEPFGYRNRIRLHVQPEPFALCYKHRKSHVNLAVATCPISAPALQDAVGVLTREGPEIGIAEWASEVELFTNHDDSAMLAAFWTERPQREAQRLLMESWPRLQQRLPEVIGAGVLSVEQRRQPSRQLAQVGESALQYQVGGRRYRVSLGSFFQVNRFFLDRLVELVTKEASGSAAWDLYAGVGLFSLALAERFAAVTAVESAGSSARDLRENLRGTHHRVVASETAGFLRRTIEQRTPAPDRIVVDPPRAGLGQEVTTLLGKLRAPRITYVSCDPPTLGRDLGALVEVGYSLESIVLVDLFPQTFHLETVSELSLT